MTQTVSLATFETLRKQSASVLASLRQGLELCADEERGSVEEAIAIVEGLMVEADMAVISGDTVTVRRASSEERAAIEAALRIAGWARGRA